MIELTGVAIYAVILWLATAYFARGYSQTKEGFLVANRNIGLFAGALSIGATWLWAPGLFVSATKAYTLGLPGLFWFCFGNILTLGIFGYFATKLREMTPNGFTLSEYIGDTISRRVQKLYWIELGFLTISAIGIQLLAGGILLNAITGIDPWIISATMAAIAISYSLFSGLKGSIVTDWIQMIIIIGGCLILVPWTISAGGGIDTVIKGATGTILDWDVFLAFGVAATIGFIAGPFGDQMFYQRTYALKKNIIWPAFIGGALLFAIVPLSMGTLGFMATGLGLEVNPQLAGFEVIKEVLPVWAIYIFLFAIMSGLLSTCDSAMCAVSSLATTDWFPKHDPIKVSRLGMIGLATLGLILANLPGLQVVHLFLFHTVFRSTTLLPTVQAILYKDVKEAYMFWGLVTSFVIGFPLFLYGFIFGGGGTMIALGAILTVGASGGITYLGRKI